MIRTLHIVLVDDQDLACPGFHMILNIQEDMCVVGQASNGVGVLSMVKAAQPDIVLMDIRMPTLDGTPTTRAVLDSHPDLKVLILTTFDLDSYLVMAMRAGVSGLLLKDSTAHELPAGIRAVIRGDSVVVPSATRRLLKWQFAPVGPAANPAGPSESGVDTAHIESIDALSDREKKIAILAGHTISNAETAQYLVLAESTIKPYLNRTLHKSELRDRAQLIVLVCESGFVRVGE